MPSSSAPTDGFDISDDIDKSERKKKPAVKKGFLRTAKARKAALYPSGSEQGESPEGRDLLAVHVEM